ncbi:MAG: DUF4038 domain-containing protein [Acidobacteriota bacterium]
MTARSKVLWLVALGWMAGQAGLTQDHGIAVTAVAAGTERAYPLKVSQNGRYLVDRNGVPFLIVGDNPQTMVTQVSTADAARFMEDRAAHGYNALWMDVLNAGPYHPATRDDGGTYDGILPFTGHLAGGSDTAHYDLSTPNEAYFQRVDQMLELASQYGFLVLLDPVETGQWIPTLENNGAAKCHAYGESLGRRYRHFKNIVWLNGNDFDHWKDAKQDEVVLAVAKGIRAAAPEQMQTVELNTWSSSSTDDPAWASLISINGTYTYFPTYLQMWHSYNFKPVMPTFLLEGHYDMADNWPDEYGTPSVLRRQEYWAMLSGAKGELYGNNYTDDFMSGWKNFVDTVGVNQLMLWHAFFSAMPWQDLVPDQEHSVVTAGYGTPGHEKDRASKMDFCTASRTEDGSVVVAYMPTPREITVNMASLKAPATAKWFDPVSGTYVTIPGGPFANASVRKFTPPRKVGEATGDGDWVLLLVAQGSAF